MGFIDFIKLIWQIELLGLILLRKFNGLIKPIDLIGFIDLIKFIRPLWLIDLVYLIELIELRAHFAYCAYQTG